MRYLARRSVHALLLLFGVSFFSFALLQLSPGDFFTPMDLNTQTSSDAVDALRSEHGLNKPLLVQYGHWLQSAMKGDLGTSFAYNSPVAPLLAVRARNTALLTMISLILAWIIAIPFGVWSAAHHGGWTDRAGGVVTSALATIPDLMLFLALLLLAVRSGWFPTGGMTSERFADFSFAAKVKDLAVHLFLPCLGLALASLAPLIRHVRAAMIEVLDSPFIRAARAQGIPEHRVLLRYAFPVAANPLITLFGFSVAAMLSASLLVEVILGWPGIGPLLLEAILAKDVFLVIGAVMLSAIFLVIGNLVSDALLVAIDPRIRLE